MNNWEYHPFAIVESDDTCDRWDRNGLNFLFHWKAKYPDFRITLFTIPERTSARMLELLSKHRDWIELAVHGWNHESNFECYSWSYDKTMAILERVEKTGAYVKIFKAPGWTITPGHNGYPADEHLPIYADPTGVYRALTERGYWIVDRDYNFPARPSDSKIICIDCNPDIVHMHTWNMETGDKNGRNGYQQVVEEHGEPWDEKTEFRFMSEAIALGRIKQCKNSILSLSQ